MEEWLLLAGIGLFFALIFKWIFLRPSVNGLPPSPRALPFLGHFHLVGKFLHHSFGKIADEHGPCVLVRIGSYPYLLVSSGQAAKEALRIRDVTYSSRPVLTPGRIISYDGKGILWSPYGEYWRNLRKICTLQLLTSKQVELSQSSRAEEMALATAQLVEASARTMPVNLTEMVSDLTYGMILRKVLGKRFTDEDHEAVEFKQLIKRAFVLTGHLHMGDSVPWLKWLDFAKVSQAKFVHKELDKYLQKQIDEHRKGSEDFDFNNDFISVMLRSEDFCEYDTSMKALTLDMIAGGTDTTSVTIDWAMAELVRNPEIMSKLQEELVRVVGPSQVVEDHHLDKLVYLSAVVNETFRLHPPAAFLLFETNQACKIMDYSVAKGTRVFINSYKIGRDESIWKESLKFRPERFVDRNFDLLGVRDFDMLPFGSGRRGCPGYQLGLRVVNFILANLVHKFQWKTFNNEEIDMSEAMGITIPRAAPLKLIPSLRSP